MKSTCQLAIGLVAGAVLGGVAIQWLQAQEKPPVHVVAEIEVTDAATYQTCVDRNGALVQSFGGRFLARGGTTEAIAGPPPRPRVAIYTFDSLDTMQAWRHSAPYQELIAIRDQSSNVRSFAVEGLPK